MTAIRRKKDIPISLLEEKGKTMNTGPKMREIYTAKGMLDAETVRLYLKSYEIEATVYQESAGIVYGLTVGALGAAHIYVEEKDYQFATQLIREMLNDDEPGEDFLGENDDQEYT